MEQVVVVFAGICVLAVLKIIISLIFKKKVGPVNREMLKNELADLKNPSEQIFVLYEEGYWEFKEESHSKEWHPSAGTMNFVDFDTNVDEKRYKKMMNKPISKDEEGIQSINVLMEIELSKYSNLDELLDIKA